MIIIDTKAARKEGSRGRHFMVKTLLDLLVFFDILIVSKTTANNRKPVEDTLQQSWPLIGRVRAVWTNQDKG